MYKHTRIALALAGALLAAPAFSSPDVSAAYKAAIENPARADDRKDDAKRKPEQFLEFAQVKPGMKIADIVTGGGYTAELMALVVGDKGEVWAHANSDKGIAKIKERLAAKPQANIHTYVAGADGVIPAGTPPLDLITINMNYHDIVNSVPDRTNLNKQLFAALKPGGHLVIIDNSAKAGTGFSATNTLHRIDEEAVIAEVSKAGFVVDGKSDYLRVPADPREEAFFKMNGKPDDKFAVRFVKK